MEPLSRLSLVLDILMSSVGVVLFSVVATVGVRCILDWFSGLFYYW